jgi:hypothetical protein
MSLDVILVYPQRKKNKNKHLILIRLSYFYLSIGRVQIIHLPICLHLIDISPLMTIKF